MERKPLRVLIADDCKDSADSLLMLVRIWNHEVCVAYDGAAALEAARNFQPDVLLLDIAMPKLDGFKVAQRLRCSGLSKHALVIAITGYADAPHRLLWELAFDHFLTKPADPAIVEALLLSQQRRLMQLAARLATPRALGVLLADGAPLASARAEPATEPTWHSITSCPLDIEIKRELVGMRT